MARFGLAFAVTVVIVALMLVIKPGWNNRDQVSTWHNGLSWLAIGVLGLLVAAEIVDKVYGDRLSELEAQESTAKIAAVEKKYEPRSLSEAERTQLLASLGTFPRGSVTIWCPMNDSEAEQYAKQLTNALRDAGWTVSGVDQAMFDGNPIGLRLNFGPGGTPDSSSTVRVNRSDVPQDFLSLQTALQKAGIPVAPGVNVGLPLNDVQIIVGHKQFDGSDQNPQGP